MPVIHFTAADALQTTVVKPNIYPTEITNIDGPKKSTSGKSINFIVDFQITEGEYKGKLRTVMFNDEMNNISLMGDMQFFPKAYFLNLDSAITGRTVTPEDYALDLDSLKHKPFDAAWGVQTVDGHLINVINSFHPRGYGANAPAF